MKDCGDDDDDRCDSITTRVREEREDIYMWLKVRRSGKGGPKWKRNKKKEEL